MYKYWTLEQSYSWAGTWQLIYFHKKQQNQWMLLLSTCCILMSWAMLTMTLSVSSPSIFITVLQILQLQILKCKIEIQFLKISWWIWRKNIFWILSSQFLVVSGSAWSWIICINLGNYKLLQRTSDSCLLHHTPHCFLPGYDDGNRINRCPPTLTTGVYFKSNH